MAQNTDINKGLNLDRAISQVDVLIQSLANLTTKVGELNSAVKQGTDTTKQSDEAGKAKKKTLTEIEKLEKQNIKTLNKLKAAASEENIQLIESKTALAAKNKAIRDNVKAENERISAIRNAENALEKEIKTIRDAEKQNRALSLAVKNLDTTTKKGRATIARYNSVIDKNTAFINKNLSAEGKRTKGIGKYKEGVMGAAKQLAGFTSAITLAVMGLRKMWQGFKDINEEITQFEKGFVNVLTLLDESQKKEFKDVLREGTIDLMSKYGLTIDDVNQSLFDVISAGVPAGEAIEFLDKASKMAIAGGAQLSEVVSGATTVLENYGKKGATTEEILNGLFATQVEGKTTVADLSRNLGKVTSTAAAAGIPLNQLYSTLAGLTKSADNTEDATTALINTIKALIDPSDQATAVFKELGIETGITAVKEDGLLTKVLEVAAAYEGNNDILTELIPNIRGFKGVAALTPDVIADIEKNTAALNDTQRSSILVQNAYNEVAQTSANQDAVLKSSKVALHQEMFGEDSRWIKLKKYWKAHNIDDLQAATKQTRIMRDETSTFYEKYMAWGRQMSNRPFFKMFFTMPDEETTIEKIVGKMSKEPEAVAKIADETLDETKNLTTELTAEEEKRQKKLAAIRAKSLEMSMGNEEIEELDELMAKQEEETDTAIKMSEKSSKAAIKSLNEFKKAQDELDRGFDDYQDELDKKLEANEQKIKLEENYIAERDKLFEDFDKEMDEQLEDEVDAHIEANEKKLESDQEYADKLTDLYQYLYNTIGDAATKVLGDQFDSLIDSNLATFTDAQDEKADALEEQLDSGLISEEEYNDAIEKLEKETAIEQAKADKKKSLFNIAVSTAEGAIKAVAASPATFGLPYLPFVLTMGAIEAAAVAAEPLPTYAKGTNNAPGGLAIVGEEGTEAIERNGQVFFTPDVPTLVTMQAGDKVLPTEKTKEKYGGQDKNVVKYLRKMAMKEDRGLTQLQLRKELKHGNFMTEIKMKLK